VVRPLNLSCSRLAILAAPLGLLLLWGCSGDEEPAVRQQDVQASESASPVDTETGSDGGEGFVRFESANGYTIEHPTDWNAEEDAGKLGSFTFDAYTAPQPDGEFLTNINVLCEEIPSDMDTSGYLEANQSAYEAQGLDPEVVGEIPAGDDNAVLVEYSSSILETGLEFSQALLAVDGCGWVITLTTPTGLRAEYKDIFLTMVESFEPK